MKDLFLEVADAAFATVRLDERLQGPAADVQLIVSHSRVSFGLWNEIFVGDVHLLFSHVARDADHFHTIAQRFRNRVQHVGSADEKYLTNSETKLTSIPLRFLN